MVRFNPGFGNPSAFDAEDPVYGPGDLRPGACLLSLVAALRGPASRHKVSFGNHLLRRHLEIGEGREQNILDKLLVGVAALQLIRPGPRMVDVLGDEKLVEVV